MLNGRQNIVSRCELAPVPYDLCITSASQFPSSPSRGLPHDCKILRLKLYYSDWLDKYNDESLIATLLMTGCSISPQFSPVLLQIGAQLLQLNFLQGNLTFERDDSHILQCGFFRHQGHMLIIKTKNETIVQSSCGCWKIFGWIFNMTIKVSDSFLGICLHYSNVTQSLDQASNDQVYSNL